MRHDTFITHNKDPELWEIAKNRSAFKSHLASYLIVNTFLWLTWFMSGQHYSHNGLPWAIWPTFGWGIGLAFHYLGAYIFPKSFSTQEEYEKLQKQQH